jgi:hypothetical protein
MEVTVVFIRIDRVIGGFDRGNMEAVRREIESETN